MGIEVPTLIVKLIDLLRSWFGLGNGCSSPFVAPLKCAYDS